MVVHETTIVLFPRAHCFKPANLHNWTPNTNGGKIESFSWLLTYHFIGNLMLNMTEGEAPPPPAV